MRGDIIEMVVYQIVWLRDNSKCMPSAEHEFVYFIWARQAIKTNKIIRLNNDHLRYGIGVQRPSYKTTIFYMQIVEMSLLSLFFFFLLLWSTSVPMLLFKLNETAMKQAAFGSSRYRCSHSKYKG